MNGILQEWIWNRLNKWNRNSIATCVGEPGSGKSHAMLGLAVSIDSEFTLEQCVFEYDAFVDLLVSDDLKRGSIIIWDEAGVDAGSREAMTRRNRHISKIAQTFRHKNYGLFMTVPNANMIDKHMRMLTQILFTARGYDSNGVSLLSVARLQHNEKLGKTYVKKPKFNVEGKSVSVPSLRIPHVKPKIWRPYEKKKTEFTTKLNMANKEESRIEIGMSFKDKFDAVKQNMDKYVDTWRGHKRVNKDLINFDINMGELPNIKVDELRSIKAYLEETLNAG